MWVAHMLLYGSPWKPFLSGMTYCTLAWNGRAFPCSRARHYTNSPGASQAPWIHPQSPFQHQRWPLLETGGRGKMDHWACSGLMAPVSCSTGRVVSSRSAASGGHLPADEQWDCSAAGFGFFCCYWNVTLADSSVGSHIWRLRSAGMGETGQIVEAFHIWGQFMPDEPPWKLLALHQPRGWPVRSTDSLWCRCHD